MSGEASVKRPCPICGATSIEAYRPFCSKRCADIDLNRWLSGAYVAIGSDDDEDAKIVLSADALDEDRQA